MALRTRSASFVALIAFAAVWMTGKLCFVSSQPKVDNDAMQQAQAAMAGFAAATVPLAAEAAVRAPGPLTGAEACSTKPLFYLIAPLCDLSYLTSPIYMVPLAGAVFYPLIT